MTFTEMTQNTLLRVVRKLINTIILIADRGKPITNKKQEYCNINEFLLKQHLNQVITVDDQTALYRTILKSRHSYSLFAQARMILVLTHLYQYMPQKEYLNLALKIGNYLIAHQKKNKLFAFNNPWWIPKDEGIMTSLAIISLCDLFKISADHRYLKSAEEAAQALRKYLFIKGKGYVHTSGQNFWCINVSVAAAYGLLRLYQITSDKRYKDWARDGFLVALEQIREDGLFPYSGIREGVYLTSYHAIGLFYLIQIYYSGVFKNDQKALSATIGLAVKALLNLVNLHGAVEEPDSKMDGYINSHAATYAALSFFSVDEQLLQKIKGNISKFKFNDRFYLYRFNTKLFWSYHRLFRDVITLETLLWLIIGDYNMKNPQGKIRIA